LLQIPHEIGDFALHMQCGATKSSAIAVQLLTAFGAIVGGVCVLLLGAC
jgi:zinc transporter 7